MPTTTHRDSAIEYPRAASSELAGERLLWADAAKAVTIFLVVLNHLTIRHYAELDFGTLTVAEDAWRAAVEALNPVRMPLFFVLSGFFAASALKRSWSAVWRQRVLRPYYLFALWLGLHAVFFAFETTLATTRVDSASEYAAQLVQPSSNLWFLHALSVHFAIAFALRGSAPGWALVGITAALVVLAAPVIDIGPVVQNLPFFLFGAYCPQVLRALAATASARRGLALLLAYIVLIALTRASGVADLPAFMLAVSAVGVSLGVTAIVLSTAACPTFAVAVARLGRRSLAIYVLHMPAIALVHHVVSASASPDSQLIWLAYPLFATSAVVLASVVVHRWLTTTLSLPWLFDLPGTGTAARVCGEVVRGAALVAPSPSWSSRRRFAA